MSILRLIAASATAIGTLLTADPIQAFGSRHPAYYRADTTPSPSSLGAIIYGGDDDGSGEEWTEGYSTATSALDTPTDAIMESMSEKLGTQSLLRIACAFAPPPHDTLHPQDAIGANLVSVDSAGVQIAVAVNDGLGGAAQVLVPVQFPEGPCHDEGCMLEALQQLDSQAHERIARTEWSDQNADELAEQREVSRALQEEPAGYDLPDWWTYAGLNMMLEEECSLLKGLLNEEDFSNEISALFRQRYDGSGGAKDEEVSIRVLEGCVASVGPSGLFLRVRVEEMESDAEEGGGPRYSTKELAIQFDDEARSADQLRSSVLRLVESVEEEETRDEEEEMVVSTEVSMEGARQEEETMEEEKLALLAEVTKKVDAFQRNLLAAKLQNDRIAVQKQKAKRQEAFQRRLLHARLKCSQEESNNAEADAAKLKLEGKPAASREEDLELTFKVIMEHIKANDFETET